MNKNMNEILEIEKQIEEMICSISAQACAEIENSPMPGVKKLGGNAVAVKLSEVMKNHNLILTPEYYIPESQARVVATALSGVKRASELQKKVMEMLRTKSVKIGGNTHVLNPQTLAVLANYVTSE